MSPFLFLFVFCVVPISADLKECTAKEQIISQGKCARHVNDLMLLTEEQSGEVDVPLEVAKNISTTCETVTSCFGGLQCAEAQRNFKIYEQKCEKINFKSFGMMECMSKWFSEIEGKNLTCTGDFDYLSKDMKTKREAYTSGKSCFINFAEKNCSSNALEYLKNNYEKVLEILTEPSDNCKSLHNELMSKQCDALLLTMTSKMMTIKLANVFGSKKDAYSSLETLCSNIKDCYSGLCYYNQNTTDAVNEVCDEMMKEQTMKPKTYHACYMNIFVSSDTLDYDCVSALRAESENSHKTTEGKPKFMEDKECLRTVMEGECEKEAVSDFDFEWEKQQKYKQNSRNQY
ncbi:hypothetical protein B9Z55_017289 [Caenorhabditis nigoni]|uniref:T20D4.11-like domain-containing protein n=1 Tax=Caenorhabditis nigoni TaxID=1611254 RepID=A0A2G5T910_9PELO|nr:hypothetical protein B9Z55_017289 [Caenorhabditis nigoni]